MNGFATSWWLLGAFAALFVLGMVLLFRSLRRWKQPPAGNDPEAQAAEMRVQAMGKRTGGHWGS